MSAVATLLALAIFAAPTSTTSATTAVLVGTSTAASSTSSAAFDLEGALGPVPMTVTADRLVADVKRSWFIAEGDVTIERGGVVLRANRVAFDDREKTATATGDVVVVDGRTVAFCSAVTMRVPELLGNLANVTLYLKTGIPEELRATLARAELPGYGKNELTVSADSLERTGRRRFLVEGGSFTACGCSQGEAPTWSIASSRGDLDLDSGAVLWFPVFYAKGVPFFALPAFYVPLGPRRTGLLIPRVAHTSVTGFEVHQPLFIALSESWDTTLEPGFLFSRGFTGTAELRFAPSIDTRGEVRVTGLLDRGAPNANGGWSRTRDGAVPRYAISGRQRTAFSGGALETELNLFGDPAYPEFADRYLARRAEYAHSRVTYAKTSSAGVRLSAGLSFLEDLRPESYVAAGRELRQIGVLSGALPGPGEIRYRLAELRLDAPLSPIPWSSGFVLGDALARVDFFTAPRPEVPRFLRADLRPRLMAPISLRGKAVLEPYFALRLTGWAGRAANASESATRAALIAGGRLSTDIFRDFAEVRHSIRPSIEYRIIPFVSRSGTDLFRTDDEVDRLEAISQVIARLETDVVARSGRRLAGLGAAMGRDLSFRGRRGAGTSELVLRGDAALTPRSSWLGVSADGSLAFDSETGVFTERVAGLVLSVSRTSLSLRYGDFAARPPLYPLTGPEDLVASSADPLALARWSAFRGLAASARAGVPLWEGWGRIDLGVDATLVFEKPADRPADPHGPVFLRDTRSSLGWTSSCDCFGVGVTVVTDRSRPGFDLAGVLVDLGRLGGVRTQ